MAQILMLNLLLQGAARSPGEEVQNGRKPPKDKKHKSRKRKSRDAEDDPPAAAPAALVNGLAQGQATSAAAGAAAVLPLTGSTAACLRLAQDTSPQLQVMTADTTYGCLLSQEAHPLPSHAQRQRAGAPLCAVQLASGAGNVAVLAAGEAFFASLQVRACSRLSPAWLQYGEGPQVRLRQNSMAQTGPQLACHCSMKQRACPLHVKPVSKSCIKPCASPLNVCTRGM